MRKVLAGIKSTSDAPKRTGEEADESSRILIGENAPIYPGFRTHLPAEMKFKNPPGLFQLLKDCIGKDVTRITMPINLNEPLTLIQRFAEHLEYIHLLYKALEIDNSLERLKYVSAYVISNLSGILDRIGKPFNPILGETYEMVHPDGSCRFFAEQVSHHPPISAFSIEDIKGRFKITGSCQPKIKFTGRTVIVQIKKLIELELNDFGETYSYGGIDCVIDNLFFGRPKLEYNGTIVIKNQTTNEYAKLQIDHSSFFGRKKQTDEVEGFIFDKNNDKKMFIYGYCNSKLFAAPYNDQINLISNTFGHITSSANVHAANNDESLCAKLELEGSSSSSKLELTESKCSENDSGVSVEAEIQVETANSSQEPSMVNECTMGIPEVSGITVQQIIWSVSPRPLWSKREYNFTSFATIINEITPQICEQIANGTLPPTDSRLRPDMRLFENGDWEEAANEKTRLEKKARSKSKDKWVPLWFYNDDENDQWISNGTYWNRNYQNCPDIF